MKSMDDVRFVPGQDGEVLTEVELVRGQKIECLCLQCGHISQYVTGEMEEFIESEERDPDIEYLKCKYCNKYNSISNGSLQSRIFHQDSSVLKGKLQSDGYFVYIISEGRKERVN